MRRPHWNNNSTGAFLLLGGGVAGHVMLETARDALFLANLPPTALPWAYLSVAVFSALIVLFMARHQHRINTRKLITASYLGVSLVTLTFYGLLKSPMLVDSVAFILYVWVGVYIAFLISSTWLLISSCFTLDRAKRSYGFVSAGASIGAIAGGAAAVALTSQVHRADTVLLAACGVFALTSTVPYLFHLRPLQSVQRPAGDTHFFSELRSNSYLQTIAGVALFSTAAVTALDWIFKTTVAASIPPEELGSFFATFYFAANSAALLAQLFLVQLLFRFLGVTYALYLFAGIVLAGSVFILGAAGFYAVVSLKLAEVAFKNSLHKPALELLYVPLRDHVRKRFKLVLDLISLRGGQALASIAILLSTLWIDRELVAVLTIIVGFAASLTILARLRPQYVRLFKDYLREGRVGASPERPELDLTSIETILDTLNSDNDGEVIAAIDFLENEGKSSLIPGLILFHPSERVVLTALAVFTAHPRPELKDVSLRLLRDPRYRVKVATLRLLMHFEPPEAFLRALARGPDRALHATAIFGMVMFGHADKDAVRGLVEEKVRERDIESLLEVCEAMEFWETDLFIPELTRMFELDDISVKRSVLVAFAKVKTPESLDIAQKAYRTPALRIEAEKVLVARGRDGFERLLAVLHSEDTEHEVRIAVPVSLAKFEFPGVQDRILESLVDTKDGAVAFKLLRALGRKRRHEPGAPLRLDLLDQFQAAELRRLDKYLDTAGRMVQPWKRLGSAVFNMLFELIVDRAEESLERIFRVYDLRYPHDDFEQMYMALTTGTDVERANAQELLLHTVAPSQSRRLIQNIAALKKLRQASTGAGESFDEESSALAAFVRDTPGLFRQLLNDESATIRALTAYIVGYSGGSELIGEIRKAARSDSAALNEAFDTALMMLENPETRSLEV